MSTTFKTCLFGGFDREDVISYIEKTAKENQERIRELTENGENLQRDNDAMRLELDALRERAENADSIAEKYEALRARVDEIVQRAETMEAENRELRAKAAEYQSLKDHIAEIEISAHRRTQEFRAAAIEQLHGMVAQQRSQFDQQRAQYTQLHEEVRTRLQTALDTLGQPDLSGFDNMAEALNALDSKLDE